MYAVCDSIVHNLQKSTIAIDHCYWFAMINAGCHAQISHICIWILAKIKAKCFWWLNKYYTYAVIYFDMIADCVLYKYFCTNWIKIADALNVKKRKSNGALLRIDTQAIHVSKIRSCSFYLFTNPWCKGEENLSQFFL